jgi:hypothetical protein
MIAPRDEAVAVVLSMYVPAANIRAFDGVLQELIDAARQKGRISGEVLRGPPAPSGRVYHVIYRFADAQSLQAWNTLLSGKPSPRVPRPWRPVPHAVSLPGWKPGLTSHPGYLPRHGIEWLCWRGSASGLS